MNRRGHSQPEVLIMDWQARQVFPSDVDIPTLMAVDAVVVGGGAAGGAAADTAARLNTEGARLEG